MKNFITKAFHPVREFIFGKKRDKIAPVKSLGDKGVKLFQYISPQAIVVKGGEIEKDAAIRILVRRLTECYGIDNFDKVYHKIIDREKLESTFLDNEVAIPHARYDGVKEIKAVLGIFSAGVKEHGSEKLPAQFIFLFLSPIDAFTQHLQLLTRIAFVFQDAKLRAKLLNSTDPAHIYKLIMEKEESK